MDRHLDLIFSSDSENCVVSESTHLLSTLDRFHPPLSLFFSYENGNTYTDPVSSSNFNFRKANFAKLTNLISNINFDFISVNSNVDAALETFYSKIFFCIAQSVPYTLSKHCSSSPPWYNKELRALRNNRNKLWKNFLSTRSVNDYSNYLIAYNRFSALCESLYHKYLDRMQQSLISDPKRFYQFINVKRKSDGLPSTLKLSSTSSADPETIVNLFATFFSQSYTDHLHEPDPVYFSYLNNCAQTSFVSI